MVVFRCGADEAVGDGGGGEGCEENEDGGDGDDVAGGHDGGLRWSE